MIPSRSAGLEALHTILVTGTLEVAQEKSRLTVRTLPRSEKEYYLFRMACWEAKKLYASYVWIWQKGYAQTKLGGKP